MIIKVELYEGNAYALDEYGHIWKLESDFQTPKLQCIRKIEGDQVHEIAKPSLARFDPKLH